MFSFQSPLDILITLVAFFIIFSIVVISHEFGHFIIARVNGIKVVEFTVGMGPKLLKWHMWGTLFSIRLLPIGGACMFEGEDALMEEDEELKAKQEENPLEEIRPGEEGSFQNANVWARIATVVMGPIFNILLAYILGLAVVAFSGEITPVIGEVFENSPAEKAGLQAGDEIIRLNGSRIYLFDEIILESFVNGEKEWDIEFLRNGTKYHTRVQGVYSSESDRYLIGIKPSTWVDCGNLKMFQYSWYEVRYWLKATFKSLKMLFTGKIDKDDVSGPVGVAQVIGTAVEETKPYGIPTMIINLINIAVLLSVNLGVMNLLPIPALDGGRLLFLLVEAVIHKKPPRKVEAIVQATGFIALLVLMALVFVNDVSKFFR